MWNSSSVGNLLSCLAVNYLHSQFPPCKGFLWNTIHNSNRVCVCVWSQTHGLVLWDHLWDVEVKGKPASLTHSQTGLDGSSAGAPWRTLSPSQQKACIAFTMCVCMWRSDSARFCQSQDRLWHWDLACFSLLRRYCNQVYNSCFPRGTLSRFQELVLLIMSVGLTFCCRVLEH